MPIARCLIDNSFDKMIIAASYKISIKFNKIFFLLLRLCHIGRELKYFVGTKCRRKSCGVSDANPPVA